MALYIKFDELKGDVTEKQYQGFSNVNTAHLPHVTNGSVNHTGTSTAHCGHAPEFAKFCMTRFVDGTSLQLFTAACTGKVFKKVILVDTGTQSNNPGVPYLQTTLENVRVAHYSRRYGVARPTEQIHLTYTSISDRITGMGADGRSKTSQATGFDLEQIRAM